MSPQVVQRGEGLRPYRARKVPEARVVELCGIGCAVIVLRCHDEGVAELAATLDLSTEDHRWWLGMALDRHGVPVWVRYVPDDYEHPDRGGVWERELRGTAGATPAVLYTDHDLPEGNAP